MEIKYLIPNPSEAMVLTTCPMLVQIRQSGKKYYSLEALKRWFSEVKLAHVFSTSRGET